MNEVTKEIPEQLELPFPDPGVEALTAENEALKNEIRMRAAAYDIETQLARAGARSPKLLSEQAKTGFQFDEEGRLVNAAAMIENLRRTYPEQFSAPSIDAGAGRSSGPTLTKEALSRMTPAEIRRLDWAEVRTILAG
jgi:hypothetical protein